MIINKLFDEEVPEVVKVDNKREKNYSYKERYFFRKIEVSIEKTSDKIKSVLPF